MIYRTVRRLTKKQHLFYGPIHLLDEQNGETACGRKIDEHWYIDPPGDLSCKECVEKVKR